MTFVPENAALCDCWVKATPDERALRGLNRTGLRGLVTCPKCRGAGFYLPELAGTTTDFIAEALTRLLRTRRFYDAQNLQHELLDIGADPIKVQHAFARALSDAIPR